MADDISAGMALRWVRMQGKPKDKYDLAIQAIVADLNDRRGLKGEWRQIDADIRQEIMETWMEILRRVFPLQD